LPQMWQQPSVRRNADRRCSSLYFIASPSPGPQFAQAYRQDAARVWQRRASTRRHWWSGLIGNRW